MSWSKVIHFKASIENENYYEAHQMYRTLYFRWVISASSAFWNVIMRVESKIYYCTRYVSQKKFLELEGMLFDGALLLFSHQETASGVKRASSEVWSWKCPPPGGSCQTLCWDADPGWSRPRRSKVSKTLKVSVNSFWKLFNFCNSKLLITRMYQLIPGDNVDKPLYLSTCLKWSSKDNSPVGHPRSASRKYNISRKSISINASLL